MYSFIQIEFDLVQFDEQNCTQVLDIWYDFVHFFWNCKPFVCACQMNSQADRIYFNCMYIAYQLVAIFEVSIKIRIPNISLTHPQAPFLLSMLMFFIYYNVLILIWIKCNRKCHFEVAFLIHVRQLTQTIKLTSSAFPIVQS